MSFDYTNTYDIFYHLKKHQPLLFDYFGGNSVPKEFMFDTVNQALNKFSKNIINTSNSIHNNVFSINGNINNKDYSFCYLTMYRQTHIEYILIDVNNAILRIPNNLNMKFNTYKSFLSFCNKRCKPETRFTSSKFFYPSFYDSLKHPSNSPTTISNNLFRIRDVNNNISACYFEYCYLYPGNSTHLLVIDYQPYPISLWA